MDNQQKELLRQGKDLAYLVSVALNKKQLNTDRTFDMPVLYHLCQFHSIPALIGYALAPHLSAEEAKPWKTSLKFATMRAVRFDYEREEILSFLRENHIWYMPMKGLVLRELYPDPVLREMCDNDILYDAAGYKVLNKFMLERGYKVEFDNENNHVDEYRMLPYYNFEMHKRFFMANHDSWCEYYSDMNKFLIPVSEYEYKLSDEDFYIYMMLHAYKHYEEGGTGLRTLIDCYLFNQKKGDKLDRKYIRSETKKLQIRRFEKAMRELSRKLFEGKEEVLTETEENMFLYILSSGTYGTDEHRIEKELREQSKWKYYCRRLFPDLQWYKGNAPFCYKHRWAIPFYCIYRIVDRGIRHKEMIKKELEIVNKEDAKNAKE